MAFAASLAWLGCASDELAMQLRTTGVHTSAELTLLGERAGYLDLILETGGRRYRFFAPDSEPCRAVLAPDAAPEYVQLGTLGRIESGDVRCDPVGILSLREWRDQRPRNPNAPLVPRDQATYQVFYRDDDVALARGRFALTTEIGFAGGVDSVAVIPMEPPCLALLERSVATLEFRPRGPRAFVLVADDGLCPVLGFAQVLPGGR